MNLERRFCRQLEGRKSVSDGETSSASVLRGIYLLRVEGDSSCVAYRRYSLDIWIQRQGSQGSVQSILLLLWEL